MVNEALANLGLQKCPHCHEDLPFAAFARDRTKLLGCSTTCKPCKRKYVRVAPGVSRRISQTGYEEKLRRQNGQCAICRIEPPKTKRLFVDHNHKTGTVRDLLCSHCNSLLGFAKENQDILRAAIKYIDRHLGM